jgi:hypothetical protein
MPTLDYSQNRLPVVTNTSTKINAHPPIQMGGFRIWGGSYVNARPLLREMQGVTLSIKLNGTRLSSVRAAPGKLSFGIPWTGRLTVSNYIYPSGFTPRVIIVM